MLRRNRLFVTVLVVAALLRVLTWFGYRSAVFFPDSFAYLKTALRPAPDMVRPDGYAFLLLLLRPLQSFAAVTAVQHLMGLGIGVMIYALLRRRFRLPAWGATLAAVPVLFDAYQIQLEHLVLSDAMFAFLLMAAVTVALWRPEPTMGMALAAGGLIGGAALTRTVGLPLLVVLVVYLIVRKVGWRRIGAAVVACVLPMTIYMTWFATWHGSFAMTGGTGVFLYSRVMAFADCSKMNVPDEELMLCTSEDPDDRPVSHFYIWGRGTPLHRLPGSQFTDDKNRLAQSFSKRAIMAQPLDYLKVAGYDIYRVFKWNRTVFPDVKTYGYYEFEPDVEPLPDWSTGLGITAADDAYRYEDGRATPRVVEPFAGWVRAYQDHVYLRGTMLGVIMLAAFAGLFARWRRFGGQAMLPLGMACALLVIPAATAQFDYRYVLPAVPLICVAAALGVGRDPVRRLFTRGRAGRAETAESVAAPKASVPPAAGPAESPESSASLSR
ncbi:MAG: hypothetical protein GEV11_17450 [Streptosporangiales bacterium]|nr:hypothetical protein [Streptosporangiales bacterium]